MAAMLASDEPRTVSNGRPPKVLQKTRVFFSVLGTSRRCEAPARMLLGWKVRGSARVVAIVVVAENAGRGVLCPGRAAFGHRSLAALLCAAVALLAAFVLLAVELYQHARDWELNTIVKDFTQQVQDAEQILGNRFGLYQGGTAAVA